MNMKELYTIESLDAVLQECQDHPVFILKHSTRCPISAAAYRVCEGFDDAFEAPIPTYLIKVIESRPLSNALADQTGIEHQSPQLILLYQGRALWKESHYGITKESILKAYQIDVGANS